MGMFDWVRSSYDLGPQLTDVECQTKDIEDYGIGGTMTQYWISPDGYLYVIDYSGTQNLEMYEPGDPGYDEECGWRNIFSNRFTLTIKGRFDKEKGYMTWDNYNKREYKWEYKTGGLDNDGAWTYVMPGFLVQNVSWD